MSPYWTAKPAASHRFIGHRNHLITRQLWLTVNLPAVTPGTPISKANLPGYLGFFQFLRNVHQRNAFDQAELILQAALNPTIADRARRGEFVRCFDHFDLLQTPIN